MGGFLLVISYQFLYKKVLLLKVNLILYYYLIENKQDNYRFKMILVQLNGKGSFNSYESEHGLIVVIGDRKFVTRFDSSDEAYIGIDGIKHVVTWF